MVGDEAALAHELARDGVDWAAARDPWGQPYRLRFDAGWGARFLLELWSRGPDRLPETDDDHNAWTSSVKYSQYFSKPVVAAAKGLVSDSAGALVGVVTDDEETPLPGVTVVAWSIASQREWLAVTDYLGHFSFTVPPGTYQVVVSLDGFSTVEYPTVLVGRRQVARLDVELAAAVEETITVTSVSRTIEEERPSRPPPRIATPRLRRDFPETLLWLSELVTDDSGRTTVTFDLADNITTWKVAALASTADGRLASVTHDLTATQPFYLELDLPPSLTAGDEVAVPVYLHNRSGRPQTAEVLLAPSPEDGEPSVVHLDDDAVERVDVWQRFPAAGEVAVRVTAAASQEGDAVEKTVAVRFDGRQRIEVTSRLLRAGGEVVLEVPDGALPGSGNLEVVVYEGLEDHLLGALRGLARRPTGCAEQIISSAYVSLLLLRALDARGQGGSDEAETARRNLRLAHDSLTASHTDEGGFAYWRGGKPELALTVYALDFLLDLGPWIAVDEELIQDSASWLRGLQREDGSWSGDEESLEAARERLRTLARDESGIVFWHLRRNTLFHGWGAAGRLETTALAVRALLAGTDTALDPLAGKGLSFLLLNKDSDGLWASTQATAQVLFALTEVLGSPPAGDPPSSLGVLLDRASLGAVERTRSGVPAPPILAPLTAGRHQLRLAPLDPPRGTPRLNAAASASWTLIQARVRYFVPWDHPEPSASSAELLYDVTCGPHEAGLGAAVTCEVEVERVGFRGYGMLIAEIGLPPGADVDRESLDSAAGDSPGVQRYEVWPDRVVAYLWPRAGGTRFRFFWRPRMALRARSAPSALYDYYNPAARVALPPVDYRVGAAAD